jgi:ABC-type amino acid transport substrate-binding protein
VTQTRLTTWLLLTLLGCSAWAAPERLRIGVVGREAPQNFVEARGALRGFDRDVAQALCAHLRVQCELVPVDRDNLLAKVQDGSLDAAVASLSVTAAPPAQIGFTRPYHRSPGRFVARTDRFGQIDADAIKGKRIGVRRGTAADDYLVKTYPDQPRLVRYSTTDDALLDLLLGRLDLVFGGQLLLDQGFLRKEQGRGFAFVGQPPADPRLSGDGPGVAVRPDAPDLLARLDAAVAALDENGVFRHLAHRWFQEDSQGPTPIATPSTVPTEINRPTAPAARKH